MNNKESNLSNVLELYESLDVSDRAKNTFFKNVVLKEAEAAPADVKKKAQGLGLLNRLYKFWGGIEGTVKNMNKALDGLNMVIQASSEMSDEQKQADLAVIKEYRDKIVAAVGTLAQAQKQLDAQVKAAPETKPVFESAKVAETSLEQATATVDAAADAEALVNAVVTSIAEIKKLTTDVDVIEGNISTLQAEVDDKLSEMTATPEQLKAAEAVVNEKLASNQVSGSEKAIYESISESLATIKAEVDAPAEDVAPVDGEAPAVDAPVEEAPVGEAPAEKTEDAPVEEAPAEGDVPPAEEPAKKTEEVQKDEEK